MTNASQLQATEVILVKMRMTIGQLTEHSPQVEMCMNENEKSYPLLA